MTEEQLALIMLVTKALREKRHRYLAETEDDGTIVIRIFKGLDES